MKLINHTLSYLAVVLFLVIGIWAVIFYFKMLTEIYDSIDDGLENAKLLILENVVRDSTTLHKTAFGESNYAIRELMVSEAGEIRDTYFDSTLYMRNEDENEPVRILRTAFHAPNKRFYELVIFSSMVEEDDLIEDLLYAIIVLYLVLLVSVLLINNVLLKKVWKPFYTLLAELKTFRLGSHTAFTAPITEVSEFKELNNTVEALLSRNIETFNSQKQFIENASHELQTPLAISINKLELLLEKNSFDVNQVAYIASIITMLERLTRLNKSLLLLSKIENKQFSETSNINLNTLVKTMLESFRDLSDFKSVIVEVTEHDTNYVKMNADLAEILISNLLKNAIIHNVEGGKVLIVIGRSDLLIKNTRTGGALDNARIFNRFYKNSDKKDTTGLGLSIVKSITDLYGISISYSSEDGHVFKIKTAQ